MRITIAGLGTIGRYVQEVFGPSCEIAVYDPPKGFRSTAALSDTDYVFICVPTPSLDTGECDVSLVEEVVALAQPRRALVCHSTVSIGTTERLATAYDKPLVYVPEYAGESSDHPYRKAENRRFFVYGGYEPALSQVRQLFESVYPGRRHYLVEPRAAEVVKYMVNSFLALKVAFSNEFYDLCQRVGADYDLVRELWVADGRIGSSHTIVTKERGYGGRCLPKDVAAVCASARASGSPLEIMDAAQKANASHRGLRAATRSADGGPPTSEARRRDV